MPSDFNGFNPMFPARTWRLKMRSAFSQFGDIFSEFGKNIAPTYYHDRCERSVQMRLYTMHKREFVLVFSAFFASFGLFLFIGLAGPPITHTVTINATNLTPKLNNSQMATGPFILRSHALSTFSQQLWVIARIVLKRGDDEKFNKPFHVAVTIQGVSDENKIIVVLGDQHSHNRTRELHCFGSICEEFTILHLGFIDYTRYILTINFYGLERVEENYHIKDVIFYFKTYNPSFTKIEIWFRCIFIFLIFGTTCWFAFSLRFFYFYDWSIEQKWIFLLLPLLLLYNDPCFPLSFLVNSWVPGMLDAVFQATFLCALLLFWLCIYHGIRQNERSFSKFYLPKCIIIGMLWLSAFTLASWQKFNELRDPTYNYKVDTGHFMGFKGFFFTVGSIYLVYLFYLIIRAYTELRSMPYFDVRLKFLTALMIIVLSISIAITVLRFGVSVLQDNFVAELSTNYGSSAEFMSFYSLLNFYLVTMAYVYAPPKRAFFETRVKDNPTLSMINDSDEEVIYASDSENRPLNPVRKSPDKEESD
ncbi:transmembrane protein 181-like [Stegodyphus dumicola]|uniref:transmembrane protein 181-like n=1 Tax=Stegodyphus dumicola TaxID=202533 RepID=UPI0015A7699E|nr:transmembrane protein 181-like [Stegodyphus dumicola]